MKLKRPHFEKLKSLTKKQKKLILAGIALLLLILAASYTVFIAPLLQKEQWYLDSSCTVIPDLQ